MSKQPSPSNHEIVPCPFCGQDIKRTAQSCPWCGSDNNTGWSEKTYLDGIDLPYEDLEAQYEETLENEFGKAKPQKNKFPVIPLIALGLVILFVAGMVRMLANR